MAQLSDLNVADCVTPYTVRYYRGAVPLEVEQRISYLQWRRLLDDVSSATIRHEVGEGEACCHGLKMLEPFADQAAIHRGEELVWAGPVTQVRYGRSTVQVQLMDTLGWLLVRTLHQNHTLLATDLTDIFETYWHDAIDLDPVPYTLELTPTGILADRTTVAADVTYAIEPVQELLDTGLDATALGHKIIAGVIDAGVVNLTTDDFQGDPEIIKDGNDYGNYAWVKGESGIIGTAGSLAGDAPYPLVEVIREEPDIQDQPSADVAAQSIIDFNRTVPRMLQTPEGTGLILERIGGVQRLIPGLIVNLMTQGFCFETTESFRLGGLTVDVTGADERVQPALEPVGSTS